MLRKYVLTPLWRFSPVFIWGICLLTLVALLLGAIFGFSARTFPATVPTDSWARMTDGNQFWEPLLNTIGFDRAIILIETNVPSVEKGRAVHALLRPDLRRATPVDLLQAAPFGSTPEQIDALDEKAEKTKRDYHAKRLVELRAIRRLLDTIKENPERFGDYACACRSFSHRRSRRFGVRL